MKIDSHLRLGMMLGLSIALSACDSRPQSKLLGTWQEQFAAAKNPKPWETPITGVQLQFFSGGSAVLNERRGTGGWSQTRTGTYNLLDVSHLKLDFGSTSLMDSTERIYLDETPRIYDLSFPENNVLQLHTADGTFQMKRVQYEIRLEFGR